MKNYELRLLMVKLISKRLKSIIGTFFQFTSFSMKFGYEHDDMVIFENGGYWYNWTW